MRFGSALRTVSRAAIMLMGLASAGLAAEEADPLAPLPEAVPAVEALGEEPKPIGVAVPSAARQQLPDRHGYAFDQPSILLRQQLIGLAHGLRLLGKACLFVPEYSQAAEQAYSEWYRKQGTTIDAMTVELERWYYGTSLPEPEPLVRLRDVVRLLGLRTELRALSDDELHSACASYAQAVQGERYDFVHLLALEAQDLQAAQASPAADVSSTGQTAEPLPDVAINPLTTEPEQNE